MKRPFPPPISVPDTQNVRAFWMKHAELAPKPIVGASSIVPRSLVPFLIRNKKVSSIARKYAAGDRISSFEAALHTLVVPVVFPVWLSGDYAYERGRHVMHRLPANRVRTVILSALIQPDFELKAVMYDIIKLHPTEPTPGKPVDAAWEPPAPDMISAETEHALKQHFVYSLTRARGLPAARDVREEDVGTDFVRIGRDVLSLEMLRNCIKEQLRVEFTTLVSAVKDEGLKLEYTWDPPVIFARTVSPDLLDEIWLEAVSSPGIVPPEVCTIAFNDFRNDTIIPRLRSALGTRVAVCRKADLGPEPEDASAIRVIHNNSDAFGQHILTSPCAASLDGAIGSCSSVAASLCAHDARETIFVEAAVTPQ